MSQRKSGQARSPRKRTATHNGTSANSTTKTSQKLPTQPAPDDCEGWKAYWEERQQTWRTEPEIDAARQQELTKCYAVTPNIEKGIYPFRDMKLSRADVEWLLVAYKDSFTPKEGLDVRGANLDRVNLSGLPLNGLCGGFASDDALIPYGATHIIGIHMRDGNLSSAHLEGANLSGAYLEGAEADWAHLERANLREAHLEHTSFFGAYLEHASLSGAQLAGADLRRAHLESAVLRGAELTSADLSGARLEGAFLTGAHLENTDLRRAHLEDAILSEARLGRANLSGAHLEGAILYKATLADREGTGPRLVGVRWGDLDLAVVDWSQVKVLGDDYRAQETTYSDGRAKEHEDRLGDYQNAVRANRRLAVTLQAQGLNEEAARFAYRANMLQRKVLWFQIMQSRVPLWQRMQKLGAWCFSHLLNILAGYGYKPGRSFLAYLLIVFGFMGFYLITSHFVTPHLSWDEALVLSLSSFHGRGFFTQTLTIGDPYARLAVAEAVMGLFVEVSLIATFTQRFFGK